VVWIVIAEGVVESWKMGEREMSLRCYARRQLTASDARTSSMGFMNRSRGPLCRAWALQV
jgi:hypothetical protein